jgi:hypothetical protein
MVTGPLVDEQIEDGQKLIDQLLAEGLDLTAVCWVRLQESEEHEWRFYIISERFGQDGSKDARLSVYETISKMPEPQSPWFTGFKLRLAGLNDPVAKEVLDFRARYPGRKWLPGANVYSKTIEQAYIYPLPAKRPAISAASA